MQDFHEFYQVSKKAHKEFHSYQSETFIIKEEETSMASPIKEELDEIDVEKPTHSEAPIDENINSAKHNEVYLEKNPLDDDLHSIASDESGNEKDDYVDRSSMSSSASSSEGEQLVKTKKVQSKKIEKRRVVTKRKSRLGKECTSKTSDEDNANKKKRKRLDQKLAEEMIQKHIPMICNLCNFDCKSFTDVSKHFNEFHSKVKPYIMCCNKKFTRRHYIAQHALQHEDPNCFRYKENCPFKLQYICKSRIPINDYTRHG